MADLSALVPEARAFLAELRAENSRDWFEAQKPRYEARLRAPARVMLDLVAADLARLTGRSCETKLFRPNRDLRFSKDKTPYHEHLHLMWTTGGAQWFFGVSPEYITYGAGRMGFAGPALEAFRNLAAGAEGAALAAEIAALGLRVSEPELKRVPAPYPEDHPQAGLLRRKSLALWQDEDAPPADPVARAGAVFARLWPVQRHLLALP